MKKDTDKDVKNKVYNKMNSILQDCEIVLNGKNKKHLTPTFFVKCMKQTIAVDNNNGTQHFAVSEDMEMTNPLVSGKKN
eukprot:11924349-Ditylum_brightwellii.AAC.1